jgi:hypothetical protein
MKTSFGLSWSRDDQHKSTQHNDTQHQLSGVLLCHYAEGRFVVCCYSE